MLLVFWTWLEELVVRLGLAKAVEEQLDAGLLGVEGREAPDAAST
jgi:hypothetical protein